MSRMPSWIAALLLAAGLCAVASLPAAAPDDKKDDKKAEKVVDEPAEPDELIELISLANKTVEFGRKNKSPETLVAAAVMFRSLREVEMAKLTEAPTDDKGKTIEAKESATKSFDQTASDLFEEASVLAIRLKLKNFDTYIKSASDKDRIPPVVFRTRDIVGGPKMIHRNIAPGETHVYHFRFKSGTPCSTSFSGSFPMTVKITRSDNDNVYAAGVIQNGTNHVKPGGALGTTAPVTIRIRNNNSQSGQYQLLVR